MGTPAYAYCRLIGNTIGLALHSGNAIFLYFAMQGDVLNDPKIKTLKETQLKFMTIWNMGFQMIFLFLSLLCDISLLLKKESKYIQYIRNYKEIFFSSIILPLSVLIFIIFWPTFIINREILFPAFIDTVVSLTSNHIMHSAILPIVLCEVFFQPRQRPRSHKGYLTHIFFIYVAYLYVIINNYNKNGVWPYPVMYMVYDTIYFPFLVVLFISAHIALYYIQWSINEYLFGKRNKSKKTW